MTDELLTPAEVANILKVQARTVRHYVNSGKLKAIKLNGYNLRIRRSEVERFLSGHETGVATDELGIS